MKLTKNQQDFIGTEFKSPKGSTLTVEDFYGLDKSKIAIFKVNCNICSNDVELFPLGYFLSNKASLRLGTMPCGCSKSPKFSKEQYLIKINRLCNDLGYVFLGIKGSWKGVRTLIKLHNPCTENTWETTTVHKFLSGTRDPKKGIIEFSNRVKIETETHVADFKKIFGEKYSYKRLSNCGSEKDYQYLWEVSCDDCKEDIFSKTKSAGYTFKVTRSSLKLGITPCRCSGRFSYTEGMMKVKIEHDLKGSNKTFVEFPDGFKNSRSLMKLLCKCCGEVSMSRIDRLKRAITQCKGCHINRQKVAGFGNGYYEDRASEVDLLYILRFKYDYSKVGRAFNIGNRLKDKKGIIKMSGYPREDIEVVAVYTGTHQQVYDTEQWLLKETKDRGFYYNSGWTTESRTVDAIPLLIKLVEGHSDLTKVDYVEGM